MQVSIWKGIMRIFTLSGGEKTKPIQSQSVSTSDTNGAGGIPRRHRAPDTGHDTGASNPRGICFASTGVRTPLIGAGGIRTPGTFRYNGFQDRRLKPLGHCSLVFCYFTTDRPALQEN